MNYTPAAILIGALMISGAIVYGRSTSPRRSARSSKRPISNAALVVSDAVNGRVVVFNGKWIDVTKPLLDAEDANNPFLVPNPK
jgi:hypothetical protein